MKSKRIWIIIGFSLFIGILLSGCTTVKGIFEESQLYYEIFNVPKKDFDSVALPQVHTFDTAKSYKEKLLTFKTEDVASGTDTESQIRRILVDNLNYSPESARGYISGAKEVGNNACWTEMDDKPIMIVVYLERL